MRVGQAQLRNVKLNIDLVRDLLAFLEKFGYLLSTQSEILLSIELFVEFTIV